MAKVLEKKKRNKRYTRINQYAIQKNNQPFDT